MLSTTAILYHAHWITTSCLFYSSHSHFSTFCNLSILCHSFLSSIGTIIPDFFLSLNSVNVSFTIAILYYVYCIFLAFNLAHSHYPCMCTHAFDLYVSLFLTFTVQSFTQSFNFLFSSTSNPCCFMVVE
jgi:hypothetical protein